MLTDQLYQRALLAQPFWTRLSPIEVKQRIQDLLAAADTAAAVRALSPVEYTVLLKEAPESRAALLALADPGAEPGGARPGLLAQAGPAEHPAAGVA